MRRGELETRRRGEIEGILRTLNGLLRVPVSLRLRVLLLLLTAHCSLLTANAQPGAPRPNSPLYGGPPSSGQVSTGLPKALKNVGIDQRLNEQIPLDAVFKDEQGREVRLGQFFKGKPVVLSLVYYTCPMLCNQVLNGMMGSFRQVSFNIGEQFDVVTVSFDPRETPELAAAKKITYVKAYNRPGAEANWHFLTGDETNIKRLTEAVGFRYYWDEQTKQYARTEAQVRQRFDETHRAIDFLMLGRIGVRARLL